LKDGKEVNAVM